MTVATPPKTSLLCCSYIQKSRDRLQRAARFLSSAPPGPRTKRGSPADAAGDDLPGERDLLAAHETALRLGAVVAAFDTATDVETPDDGLLAHVREVGGPSDSSVPRRSWAPEPTG